MTSGSITPAAPASEPEHGERRDVRDQIVWAQAIRSEIEALTNDEATVRDTLEGEVDLDGCIDFLLRDIAYNKAMQEALSQERERLKSRQERLAERTERARRLLQRALEIAGWRRRERPLATLSLSLAAPALGELDEAAIPPKFWIDQEPKLDKDAILAALKEHAAALAAAVKADDKAKIAALEAANPVPGATLAPRRRILTIRGA